MLPAEDLIYNDLVIVFDQIFYKGELSQRKFSLIPWNSNWLESL